MKPSGQNDHQERAAMPGAKMPGAVDPVQNCWVP
jgi:hypothetical protein